MHFSTGYSKTVGLIVLMVLAAVLIATAPSAKADEAEKEFVPLFNGKDLTGWIGDERLWSASDGQIVGSSAEVKLAKNSFLYTEQEFSDFVLKIKVKLVNHNSGVQFRSDVHPDYVLKGYQADVADQVYYGMLYEEGKRGIMPYWKALSDEERKAIFAAADVHGWNQYVITCKGDRIRMELNDKTVLDILDPDGAKKGVVGLQIHTGPEMEVRFKDIEIKDLTTEKE